MITETTITIKRGIREAAREAGISHGYLSLIANGKRRPSKKTARHLRALGIPVPATNQQNKGGRNG